MPRCRNLAQGLFVSGLLAGSCFAQREAPSLQRHDPQSILLYRLTLESDEVRKLVHLEEFAARFPDDSSIGWVYDQMYAIFLDTNRPDRALAVGEKILAVDPEDVELAYKNLKIAEESKDRALIGKWAQITSATASRVIASPRDSETGKRRLDVARQIGAYIDYLAYTEILQTVDRSRKLELMEAFLQSKPGSTYVPAVQRLYLAYWREVDVSKAVAIAEQIIETDKTNEDALILVAENYAQKDKEPGKTVAYATRVIALMDHATNPDGIPDAEWTKKKVVLTGRANWLIGSIAMQQNKFGQADKSIRAALPYLKSDLRLISTALFYLGWANYKMGNIAEAIRFTQDCTRVKGPFQQQAVKNLAVIQAEKPAR